MYILIANPLIWILRKTSYQIAINSPKKYAKAPIFSFDIRKLNRKWNRLENQQIVFGHAASSAAKRIIVYRYGMCGSVMA